MPTGFEPSAIARISAALTVTLADFFALYVKTKNFHWHVSGPHFRDYHLLMDEQSAQIFATTDAIAERVRKIGGTTLHSIGHIARLQRVADNDNEFVAPQDMLAELCGDNRLLTIRLRSAHSGDTANSMLRPIPGVVMSAGRGFVSFETKGRLTHLPAPRYCI